MTIKFAKTAKNAVIPHKRDCDAGYDLYALKSIQIAPNETVCVPIGIASIFDEDYQFMITGRSSVSKQGIITKTGIIDSGYRGEWHVMLYNATDKSVALAKEHAIAQALFLPVPSVKIQEVAYKEIQSDISDRRTGSFGSANKAPKMLTIPEIVRVYPDLGISTYALKCLVAEGKITSVRVGKKKLISVQSVFNLLKNGDGLSKVHENS